MGTEINNNNGVKCYRATAVFLPLAYKNSVPNQRLQVNEQSNSKLKCDIRITFQLKLF
jgi:hypothetical protein